MTLIPENVDGLISKAAQSDLASYLIVVAVVWKVMGAKVASHFKLIETGLASVAQEVANLRGAVQADLKVQAFRLDNFETSVGLLGNRVEGIEKKIMSLNKNEE